MGMDYRYAGSASYLRFKEELTAVVSLFGGMPSEQYKIKGASIQWWKSKSILECDEKFIFTKEVPVSFKKWANHPYDELTLDETKEVQQFLSAQRKKVEEISSQIMHEFDSLIEFEDYWAIS